MNHSNVGTQENTALCDHRAMQCECTLVYIQKICYFLDYHNLINREWVEIE